MFSRSYVKEIIRNNWRKCSHVSTEFIIVSKLYLTVVSVMSLILYFHSRRTMLLLIILVSFSFFIVEGQQNDYYRKYFILNFDKIFQ